MGRLVAWGIARMITPVPPPSDVAGSWDIETPRAPAGPVRRASSHSAGSPGLMSWNEWSSASLTTKEILVGGTRFVQRAGHYRRGRDRRSLRLRLPVAPLRHRSRGAGRPEARRDRSPLLGSPGEGRRRVPGDDRCAPARADDLLW